MALGIGVGCYVLLVVGQGYICPVTMEDIRRKFKAAHPMNFSIAQAERGDYQGPTDYSNWVIKGRKS